MHKGELLFPAQVQWNIIFSEKYFCFSIDTRISEREFLQYHTYINSSLLCSYERFSQARECQCVDIYPYSFS